MHWIHGSGNFLGLVPKNVSWRVGGNPERQGLKRLRWEGIERPSSVQCPQNHIDLMGNLRVRNLRTPPAHCLSNQRDFVGLGQGSDARILLNQRVWDFAIWDFPQTFKTNFLVLKLKISPTLAFSPLQTHFQTFFFCDGLIEIHLNLSANP